MTKGSAPGERRGGRQKGTPNKSTLLKRAQEALVINAQEPQDFWYAILRHPDMPLQLKAKAAEVLMPYRQPKLSAILNAGGPTTHEERLARLQSMAAGLPQESLPTPGGTVESSEGGGPEKGPIHPPVNPHNSQSTPQILLPPPKATQEELSDGNGGAFSDPDGVGSGGVPGGVSEQPVERELTTAEMMLAEALSRRN